MIKNNLHLYIQQTFSSQTMNRNMNYDFEQKSNCALFVIYATHTHTHRAIRYIIHIRNAALLWTHHIFLNYVFNVPLDDMQMLLDVIEVLDCLVRSESACVTLLLTHCQLLQWAWQWVSTNRNIKTTLEQCFICPHVLKKKHSWIWVRHHMKYY